MKAVRIKDDLTFARSSTIKIGTPRKVVIDTLGPPLEVDTWKDIERLHYSTSPTGSHYRVRQVCLAEGKVVKKVHYYYVD
jgi:hypothetical protein